MKPGEAPPPSYRPLNARRRWLLALLAVAMAFAVIGTLLDPPGGVKRVRRLPADAPGCAAGQDSGCVGGRVDVIMAAPPPAQGASRP